MNTSVMDLNNEDIDCVMVPDNKLYVVYDDYFMSVQRGPPHNNHFLLGDLDSEVKLCYILELSINDSLFYDFWKKVEDPTLTTLMKQSLNLKFFDEEHHMIYSLLPWSYPKSHLVIPTVGEEWIQWAKTRGDVSVSLYEVQIGAWYMESLCNNCPVVAEWRPPSRHTSSSKLCILQ